MSEDNGDVDVYHERQIKELCALHALNNLFKDGEAFSKKDMDEICLRYHIIYLICMHKLLDLSSASYKTEKYMYSFIT